MRIFGSIQVTQVSILICLLASEAVQAQIVPDSTLPVNSSITVDGDTSIINGGTQADSNLFHSFEQFSIPTGRAAYFNNSLDIQNIISRVTGGSVSNIDGLLRANGAANLFLLNPNGIVFGSNATLNIGGSFLASTASGLIFADGTEFNATAPQTTPLLTLSRPIGLKLASNPGAIRVQGSGHSLIISSLFSPISGAGASSNGLRVLPGRTLALVGGNIALEGGILTAPGGRVELGSVGDGVVSINPAASGWVLGYQGLQTFQDIALSQRALVDASGFGNSSLQLVGKQISFTEGSVGLIQNQGTQAGGGINVQASDLVQLSGTSSDGMTPSGFEIETLGGSIGNTVVSTKYLSFENGAAINSKTFADASASNVVLNASESVQVKGFSFINPTTASIASGVGAYTFGVGSSGTISINTGRLSVLDGGTVTSGTFGSGNGGDLTINADNNVELSGFNPILSLPSQLGVGAYKSGNSGNLNITAPEITLDNGGSIASYTFSSGNAGDIIIKAPNFINITTPANIGGAPYEFFSGIASYAVVPPIPIQQVLGLSPEVSGAARNIKIETGRLSISKGTITVSNLGTGSAGDIDIDGDIISLENNSSISAATAFADGGNIFLKARNLQLLHNSTITATASNPQAAYRLFGINFPYSLPLSGTGNGGNITINTDRLISLRNSDITANAFEGQGGNIRISTQGIFRSPNSDITATSKLGVNGTVQINTLVANPSSGLDKLPEQVVDVSGLIAKGCSGSSGSGNNVGKMTGEFIIAGRGGLPPQPGEPVETQARVVSNDTLEALKVQGSAVENTTVVTRSSANELVEAQGWVFDEQGEMILTAQPPNATPDNSSFTQANCYAP